MSSPWFPLNWSKPLAPLRVSSPAPPFSWSSPASPARLLLASAVAGDDVWQGITGSADSGASQQRQFLQVVGQGVVDRALHEIIAAIGDLVDHVTRIVDPVLIAMSPARHRIAAGAAVEAAATVAPYERIVSGIAVRSGEVEREGYRVVAIPAVRRSALDRNVVIAVFPEDLPPRPR